MAEQLPGALEQAEKEKPGYTRFLHDLLAVEVDATEHGAWSGRMRFSELPDAQDARGVRLGRPARLDRRLVKELATLRFVEEKSNVLLIGPRAWARRCSRSRSG